MKSILITLLLLIPLSTQAGEPMSEKTTTFYDHNATSIIGENISMSTYKDKAVLVVNVASECGFTSQYKGLQALYEAHKENGLVILAFPSNQFGKQEPGTHEEIQKFCSTNYNITFPMFEKIDVNGENTHPLYVFLKSEATGLMWTEGIKWNFTKFLINKKGKVISRYGSSTKPKDIEADIVKLLEEK
ncbi:MAG: Glutathione peroxidase family protein [uncultured Sulfurovum sp.]|uniref:Glutathione peroxidase n=1 Tax=uncultured Sulfurovum sp. TaxID=269237 RepID=A0A6S6S7C8_9BACT|nr:MAG: Glutathione peroxidase family protein [uncultured Sulfurovum sp.]